MFIGFLKKEIIQMLRNPVMIFALLFMPIVQAFLFSYAITNEPKNINIAIASNPNDYVINKIYDKSISSSWFRKSESSSDDIFKTIQSGRADVILIPECGGFSNNINKNAELQVLINASNVLRAQSISAYMKSIVFNVIKDDIINKYNVNPNTQYINFKTRILFNPEMDTKMFIVPSIMVMIVGMSILSLVCISIAREKEMGTIETLISAPIKKTDIILGKSIPGVTIAFFNMLSITILGLIVFKIPFRGHLDQFLLSFFIFSFSFASLGIFLSTFCQNQQQALLAIMMVLFIFLMLSGGMFPIENMPYILRIISNINPMSHYTYLLRNILLKGGDYIYLIKHSIPMILFGSTILIFGIKRIKNTL